MESQNRESRLDRVERMLASQAELNAQFAEQHKAAMARIEAERVRSDQEHRDAMARFEALHVKIEALAASIRESSAARGKWVPSTAEIDVILAAARSNGEIIAELARIAEARTRHLDDSQSSAT